MTVFSQFEFISRVVNGFARGTPWRVTAASPRKITLRWGDAPVLMADETGREPVVPEPVPPFDFARERARADLAAIPGIKIVVRIDGRATAKLGRWVP